MDYWVYFIVNMDQIDSAGLKGLYGQISID